MVCNAGQCQQQRPQQCLEFCTLTCELCILQRITPTASSVICYAKQRQCSRALSLASTAGHWPAPVFCCTCRDRLGQLPAALVFTPATLHDCWRDLLPVHCQLPSSMYRGCTAACIEAEQWVLLSSCCSSCSTYSPVVPGGGRWWCDLLLCMVFAADYTHRIMVRRLALARARFLVSCDEDLLALCLQLGTAQRKLLNRLSSCW